MQCTVCGPSTTATSLWPTYFYNIQFNFVSVRSAGASKGAGTVGRCRAWDMELNAAHIEFQLSEALML